MKALAAAEAAIATQCGIIDELEAQKHVLEMQMIALGECEAGMRNAAAHANGGVPFPLPRSVQRVTLAYWTDELEAARAELGRWEADRAAAVMLIAQLTARLSAHYASLAACAGPWGSGWIAAAFIWGLIAVTSMQLAMAGAQLVRVERLVRRAKRRVRVAETRKEQAARDVERLTADVAAKARDIAAKVRACGRARSGRMALAGRGCQW